MNNNDKLIENVSFAVYESAMIRAERHIKRLWIALVVCIISMAVMTIGFFYYLPARRLPPLRWEMNCVPYPLDFPFCSWYNIFSRIIQKG